MNFMELETPEEEVRTTTAKARMADFHGEVVEGVRLDDAANTEAMTAMLAIFDGATEE